MRRNLQLVTLWGNNVSDGSITDDFSALQPGWLGPASMNVTGGAASITPVEGTERIANGDLELWNSANDAANWTEQPLGSSTVNRDGTNVHGGSFAARYDYDGSGSQARLFQATTAPNNTWCLVRAWVRASDTVPTAVIISTGLGLNDNPARALTTTYQQFIANGLTTVLNGQFIADTGGTKANKSVYYDDISVKPLTLSSMIKWRASLFSTNVVVKIAPTIIPGTFEFVAACGDSVDTPTSFLLGAVSQNTARLYKYVAGVITLLKSGAVTYSAGATFEIRKAGSAVGIYYNNVQISTDATVTDVEIASNTYHGWGSGYSGNTNDSFILAAA